MGCDCQPRKQELDQITGLPLRDPGDEHLAIVGPSSCATVFVAVDSLLTGLVRVNLFAELFGVRDLVASAFVPNGFRGVAIVVTGMQVDGWHVTFQATSPLINMKAGLQVGCGCSGFSIEVPPSLLAPENTEDIPPELLIRNPMPYTRRQGLFAQYTDALGTLNAVTLRKGERVVGGTMLANGLGGTVVMTLNGTLWPTVTVPPGAGYEFDDLGNLEGPGTITFANFLSWVVHTVR